MKFENEEIIAIAIAVQKVGQSTVEEIIENSKDLFNIEIKPKKAKRICEQFRKRDIFSLNYVQNDETNISETAYSMAKPIYKNIPENAHLKDLISLDETQDLINQFEGKKGAMKLRKPTIADYITYNLAFEIQDYILGGVKLSDDMNGFLRDEKKNPMLLKSNFYGWIRDNQRLFNKTNVHKYIAFSHGKIEPNGNKIEIINS